MKKKATPLQFIVDDEPASNSRLPPMARKLIAVLEQMPHGRLATAARVLGSLRYNTQNVGRVMPQLPAVFKVKDAQPSAHQRWLVGNPTTVAAYKAQFYGQTQTHPQPHTPVRD